jgi:hypothetical protein
LTESSTVAVSESAELPSTTFEDFLENKPPYTNILVYRLVVRDPPGYSIHRPQLNLYCSNDLCRGFRVFGCASPKIPITNFKEMPIFLEYVCRNCGKERKKYFILSSPSKEGKSTVVKIGELPPFGPHTPPRVITLIGPDRDLFLRGRRAETQGLGIGAFAYYRRVVENQKNRIISEIKRVVERIGASSDTIQLFDRAIDETQFSTAIEMVKDAMPKSLLILDHNPLKLLHSALSAGLHASSDEKCLEAANSIRVILTELADRTGQLLKDQAELKNSVKRLVIGPPAKPEA